MLLCRTLVYVLHIQREAQMNWDAFRASSERAKVWAETEKGTINLKVNSIYAEATDYSPIR